jgi:hypothetical protein
LPRKEFPEFSIVLENLVPACTTCNSTEKGTTYRGAIRSERLIHPYYDTWATGELWEVQFGPDLDAVVMKPTPSTSLPTRRRRTVAFHLETVLGDGWEESARRFWADLPRYVVRHAGAVVTPAEARRVLKLRLEDETYEKGHNSWNSAFLRGALADARVVDHVAARAADLVIA